jgi:MFS family permease
MLRPIVGFFVGLVVAVVVVALVETLGHTVFPPPPGVENDRTAMASYVATAPFAALLFPLLASVAGAFLGGWVAAAIGRRRHQLAGTLVGVVILALAGMNMVMIPHPVWFMLLSIMLIVPAGWLGGDLAARRAGAQHDTAISSR